MVRRPERYEFAGSHATARARTVLVVILSGCAAPKPAPVSPAPPLYTGLAAGLTTTEQVKDRMKTVSSALGVTCDHCHDVTDFAAPTPNKRIANHMAERFTSAFQLRDGATLTCVTCHQGRATFLDRADQEALKRWMQKNFVEGLRFKGGGAVACDTCHFGSRYKFLPRSL
jgi:hypothetical protein